MAKAPSERRIGARVRIKPQHAQSVAQIFSVAGFTPVYVEHRADGDISFWFDKATARNDSFIEIVLKIPVAAWAIVGVVEGPPFK